MSVKCLQLRFMSYIPVPSTAADLSQAVQDCYKHFLSIKERYAGGTAPIYLIDLRDDDSNKRLEVRIRFTESKIVWEGTGDELQREVRGEEESL